MKKIFLCTANSDEKKIAVLNEGVLSDYESYLPGMEDRRNSIFRGVVEEVEPSLNACFVNIGDSKNGFLQISEIHPSYFKNKDSKAPLNERLVSGTPMIVQIIKDSRSEKGPLLTSRIKLMGQRLVLETLPREVSGIHISRAASTSERDELLTNKETFTPPEGMNLIVRTSGINTPPATLGWELNSYLLKLWDTLNQVSKQMQQPGLMYHDMDVINRCVREYCNPSVTEILCDTDATATELKTTLQTLMPDLIERVNVVAKNSSLFDERTLGQIDALLSRSVRLPSGGEIVIDITEALIAIDVNSARARSQRNIEETALKTNLEAADEVARQLRLRNLAGIIVIDFIDMESGEKRNKLLNQVRKVMRNDRAQIQIGEISQFGMLEMTRQNIGRALHESHSVICEKCQGIGRIPTVRSFALTQIYKLRDLCLNRQNCGMITLELPVEPATYLLNELRSELRELESSFNLDIVIVPSRSLEMPNSRSRVDKVSILSDNNFSYAIDSGEQIETGSYHNDKKNTRSQAVAAISSFVADSPSETVIATKRTKDNVASEGLMGKIKSILFGNSQSQPQAEQAEKPAGSRPKQQGSKRNASDGNEPRTQGGGRGGRGRGGSRGGNSSSRRKKSSERTDRGERSDRNRKPAATKSNQSTAASNKGADNNGKNSASANTSSNSPTPEAITAKPQAEQKPNVATKPSAPARDKPKVDKPASTPAESPLVNKPQEVKPATEAPRKLRSSIRSTKRPAPVNSK